MSTIIAAIARLCLAVLFVVSGVGKLMDPVGTANMLISANLPAELAVPTGLFELLAGIALAIGLLPRLVPFALIVFTAAATVTAHRNIADPLQAAMAMKNLAIIGGFLALIAYRGARMGEQWALLHRENLEHKLDARDRTHEAELRAARAEARADTIAATPVVTDRVETVPADTVAVRPRWRWFG